MQSLRGTGVLNPGAAAARHDRVGEARFTLTLTKSWLFFVFCRTHGRTHHSPPQTTTGNRNPTANGPRGPGTSRFGKLQHPAPSPASSPADALVRVASVCCMALKFRRRKDKNFSENSTPIAQRNQTPRWTKLNRIHYNAPRGNLRALVVNSSMARSKALSLSWPRSAGALFPSELLLLSGSSALRIPRTRHRWSPRAFPRSSEA